jgi:hypothetical protein
MEADINVDALKSEIRNAVINTKANACPITMRLAWHASGTYDKRDGTGGSNGATMRFPLEANDGANKGLSIVRDMLYPVKQRHPEISYADLWCLASVAAIEFSGGPKIPFKFGRQDFTDESRCPANGRLPDALKGADHIRDVFGRMGFNDQEIVALIGGHTLGSCHLVRSGFDGPWTRNPLKFDNTFFKNLVELEWREKKWDGPRQFEDVATGELMMLPTDMALRDDPQFRVWVDLYAKDEQKFFQDFAHSYAKLISLGTPADPFKEDKPLTDQEKLNLKFRAAAMHGSVGVCKELHAKGAHANEQEKSSGRTALHKAAFWGHDATIKFLVNDLKVNLNTQDHNGDTALHDAARFGHAQIVQILLDGKADRSIKNKDGKDAHQVALDQDKPAVAEILAKH